MWCKRNFIKELGAGIRRQGSSMGNIWCHGSHGQLVENLDPCR